MSLTRSELIDVLDRLGELRDLHTVALMACSDIGDREARSGFTRLVGMMCSQLDEIAGKLDEVHLEAGDAARS